MLGVPVSREPFVKDKDYTVPQFADEVHIGKETGYRLVKDGAIPHYRVGNRIRIRREDVEAFRQPKNAVPLAVEKAAAAVAQAVDAWPALTPEQRDAVAVIFADSTGGDD